MKQLSRNQYCLLARIKRTRVIDLSIIAYLADDGPKNRWICGCFVLFDILNRELTLRNVEVNFLFKILPAQSLTH